MTKPHFIASGTEIILSFEGDDERYRSRVIGIDPEHFLVLKTPQPLAGGSAVTPLKSGMGLTIRYLYSGTVWGFRCSLIQVLKGSLQVIFASYPQEIENYDLRSSERIEVRVPARLTDGTASAEGMIVDLSLTGARFVFKTKENEIELQLEDRVELSAHFMAESDAVKVPGVIRGLNTDASRTSLGLQFGEVPDSSAQSLYAYLSRVKELSGG